MAGREHTLSFRADELTKDRIDDYETSRAHVDNRSEAISELVAIGLREADGPILHTWRESTMTVALYFACTAATILIIGYMTKIATLSAAIEVAMAFVTVGVVLVAVVELARVITGQNELGDGLRKLLGRRA